MSPYQRFWVWLIVLTTLAPVIPFVFPNQLALTSRADVFRTLADIGAALIGFVGVIGVFGLEALRSSLHEISAEMNDLERYLNEKGALESAVHELDKFRDKLKGLEAEKARVCDRQQSAPRLILVTLYFFLIQIVSSLLGLGDVTIVGDWRLPLAFSFFGLFTGVYLVYIFVSAIARITSVV